MTPRNGGVLHFFIAFVIGAVYFLAIVVYFV